jgi:hypothetical protein
MAGKSGSIAALTGLSFFPCYCIQPFRGTVNTPFNLTDSFFSSNAVSALGIPILSRLVVVAI